MSKQVKNGKPVHCKYLNFDFDLKPKHPILVRDGKTVKI